MRCLPTAYNNQMINNSISNYQLDFTQQPMSLHNAKEHISQSDSPLAIRLPVQIKEQQNKSGFKWTYEEHAKYIFFLEMNKLKIKSKLIRKSNAFFKDMEKFLQTKTALQCRSHHQKFEERYKFPHRIITGEKKYIPLEVYQAVAQLATFTDFKNNSQNARNNSCNPPTSEGHAATAKEYSTACCQTDICDVSKQLYTEEEINQPVTINYPFPIVEPILYYQPYPYHF